MRLIRILKRESPLVLAREALWRVQRQWNSRRMPGRLQRLKRVIFRNVPYYQPKLGTLTEHSRALIIAFAEEVQAGRYPLLSYGTVNLGTRPKWNVDFVSGAEWPTVRCETRECIRWDGSDVKAPFELSRLQCLPVLGKAYVLTGDASYRQAAKDLLAHWISSNPAPLGVNWTIAMEAALRAMSICFLLNLLAPFPAVEQAWLAGVTRLLAEHVVYIEANLEFSHFLTSNHYLSDIVGLYCLSTFLEGDGMAERRRDYRQRIEAEMARQVYADGGDYEASTGYQVLVTQLFSTALLLMRAEDSAPPKPEFTDRLRMMYRFLNILASAVGELPQVGDCDDGRTEFLADDLQQMMLRPLEQRNSLRISHLLGLGQRLLGVGQGHGDDAAWYGSSATAQLESSSREGRKRVEARRPPAQPISPPARWHPGEPLTVLPDSGIGVLRNGAAELLFFAIPNGIQGKGSHTHNDKLGFVLRIGRQELFCDSGTGYYTRDPELRNRLRSTAAHNTLMVDGEEQNRINWGPGGIFSLGNQAAVTPIQAGRDAGGWFLRASHAGYHALGVTHTRTIRMTGEEAAFVIEDQLEGHGVHAFEFNLQLAPNRRAAISSPKGGLVRCTLGDRQVQFTVAGPAGLQAATEPSVVSTAYGVTVPAMRLRFWGRAALPLRISTRLSWAEVTELRSQRAAASQPAGIRDAVAEGVCKG